MTSFTATPDTSWLESLEREAQRPDAGFTVARGASLARCSTLRIGGPAQALVEATSFEALRTLRSLTVAYSLPMVMVGRGANVLFPDEGLGGIVCRLAGEFKRFEINGTSVWAGAGVLLPQLAKTCAKRGLVGLEGLAGFPASVGGAVVMNAGCYGTEIAELLTEVEIVDQAGAGGVMTVSELEAGYRTTSLKGSSTVVVGARFELELGDAEGALQRLEQFNRKRWDSLPSGKPNAGSTFRNPEGDFAGRLLEQAGIKGRRRGDAAFSEKHANVLVNLGDARASDVIALMAEARQAVKNASGFVLDPELVFIGDLADQWNSAI